MKPQIKNSIILPVLVLAIAFLASACQTNETKAYNKLKPGMDKDDVLDVMGNPRATQRIHGQDKWTYVYYQDRQKYVKEVHFQDGSASYVGEVYKPEISAEEQDRRNEISNKEMNEHYLQDKAERKQFLESYNPPTPDQDKIKYVPEYKPLQ